MKLIPFRKLIIFMILMAFCFLGGKCYEIHRVNSMVVYYNIEQLYYPTYERILLKEMEGKIAYVYFKDADISKGGLK